MSVTIGGAQYPFKVCRWNPKAKMINRSNSKYSPGFEVKKSGVMTGTMRFEGPYKLGEAPLAIGGEYSCTIKPTGTHVGFTAVMLIEDMEFEDDSEDGPHLNVTAQTQADFSPTIV